MRAPCEGFNVSLLEAPQSVHLPMEAEMSAIGKPICASGKRTCCSAAFWRLHPESTRQSRASHNRAFVSVHSHQLPNAQSSALRHSARRHSALEHRPYLPSTSTSTSSHLASRPAHSTGSTAQRSPELVLAIPKNSDGRRPRLLLPSANQEDALQTESRTEVSRAHLTRRAVDRGRPLKRGPQYGRCADRNR